MDALWIILIATYLIGFVGTYLWNMRDCDGPWISPGLALIRAAVWPIWWITGRPYGQPIGPD